MTATFCGNAGGTESGLHRPAQALPASRETQDFKTKDARLEVRGGLGAIGRFVRIGPEGLKFFHDSDGRVGVPHLCGSGRTFAEVTSGADIDPPLHVSPFAPKPAEDSRTTLQPPPTGKKRPPVSWRPFEQFTSSLSPYAFARRICASTYGRMPPAR